MSGSEVIFRDLQQTPIIKVMKIRPSKAFGNCCRSVNRYKRPNCQMSAKAEKNNIKEDQAPIKGIRLFQEEKRRKAQREEKEREDGLRKL